MFQFMWNGIKVDGKLHLAYYSISKLTNHPEETITIYGKRYKDIPRIEGLNVENDSDMQSDYFENDRVRVEPTNKHYPAVKAAFLKQEEHRVKVGDKRLAKAGGHQMKTNKRKLLKTTIGMIQDQKRDALLNMEQSDGTTEAKPKVEHTPTPWQTESHDDYVMIYAGRSEADLAHVFAAGTNSGTIEEAEATAAFIVTAVNSYQPLIDAVKDIRYAFYVENSSKKLKEAMIKHAEILQNLIKQAEGTL